MAPARVARAMLSMCTRLTGVSRKARTRGRRSFSVTSAARCSRLEDVPLAIAARVPPLHGTTTMPSVGQEPLLTAAAMSEERCRTIRSQVSPPRSRRSPSTSSLTVFPISALIVCREYWLRTAWIRSTSGCRARWRRTERAHIDPLAPVMPTTYRFTVAFLAGLLARGPAGVPRQEIEEPAAVGVVHPGEEQRHAVGRLAADRGGRLRADHHRFAVHRFVAGSRLGPGRPRAPQPER